MGCTYRPVAAPKGPANFQTIHEGSNWPLDLLLKERHGGVDAMHIHSNLFHQAPALWEQHCPAHKAQLPLGVRQHQAEVLLDTSRHIKRLK